MWVRFVMKDGASIDESDGAHVVAKHTVEGHIEAVAGVHVRKGVGELRVSCVVQADFIEVVCG